MTSEAPRAASDIWKRPNLPPGIPKEEKKIDFAKITIKGLLVQLRISLGVTPTYSISIEKSVDSVVKLATLRIDICTLLQQHLDDLFVRRR
jgi:hypothetical protein